MIYFFLAGAAFLAAGAAALEARSSFGSTVGAGFIAKVAAADQAVSELPLLQEKYLVAQKGKKNYFLISFI